MFYNCFTTILLIVYVITGIKQYWHLSENSHLNAPSLCRGIASPTVWTLLVLIQQISSIQFEPIEYNGIGDSECALLINGPGRSSQFDYTYNLLRGNSLYNQSKPQTVTNLTMLIVF